MSPVAKTIEARVAILPALLEMALSHLLDSPHCTATIGVECGTCEAVLVVPTSGPIPAARAGCAECPRLVAVARQWRRARLEVTS